MSKKYLRFSEIFEAYLRGDFRFCITAIEAGEKTLDNMSVKLVFLHPDKSVLSTHNADFSVEERGEG